MRFLHIPTLAYRNYIVSDVSRVVFKLICEIYTKPVFSEVEY